MRGSLTQKDFATTIGRTINTIGHYERGERTPIVEALNKICEVYKINHKWLLTGTGPMREGEAGTGPTPLSSAPIAPAPLDPHVLQAVLIAVREVLSEGGKPVPPEKEAKIIAVIYQMHPQLPINKSAIRQLIELAM